MPTCDYEAWTIWDLAITADLAEGDTFTVLPHATPDLISLTDEDAFSGDGKTFRANGTVQGTTFIDARHRITGIWRITDGRHRFKLARIETEAPAPADTRWTTTVYFAALEDLLTPCRSRIRPGTTYQIVRNCLEDRLDLGPFSVRESPCRTPDKGFVTSLHF